MDTLPGHLDAAQTAPISRRLADFAAALTRRASALVVALDSASDVVALTEALSG